MNILDYSKNVKSVKDIELLGSLSSVTVGLSDFRETLKKLDSSNIDLGTLADHWIIPKSILKGVKQDGSVPGNVGFIQLLDLGAETAISTATALTGIVKKKNQKIWSGHTLTIQQANILNLVEHLDFWMNYATMAVDALLTQNNNNKLEPERYLDKADIRWINGTKDFFIDFTKMLMKGSISIINTLLALDDHPVDADVVEVLEGTKGLRSTSISTRGFGIHNLNPIYWYDSINEKIDLFRIENMRRNNEMFAMKINQAVNKKMQSNDPQLDRQIEVYQDQIIKNRAKIESIIGSYA